MAINNDDELNITTAVDLSGLQSGMSSGTQIVQTATTQMTSSFAQLKSAVTAAQANLAQAMSEFGAAAEAGNSQAQAAVRQYEAELANAQTALQAYTAANEEASGAVTLSAEAHTRASAAVRLFGYEIGAGGLTRQLAGVATQATGLSSIFAAAFPVFGAIALGEILYDLGGKIVDLIDYIRGWDKEAKEAFQHATQFAVQLQFALDKQGESYLQATTAGLTGAAKLAAEHQNVTQEIKNTNAELDHFKQKLDAATATLQFYSHLNITDPTSAAIRASAGPEMDQATEKIKVYQKAVDELTLKLVELQTKNITLPLEQSAAATKEAEQAAKKAANEFERLQRTIGEIAQEDLSKAVKLDSSQASATLKVFEDQLRVQEEINKEQIKRNDEMVQDAIIGQQEIVDSAKTGYQQQIQMIDGELQAHKISISQATQAKLQALQAELAAVRQAMQDEIEIYSMGDAQQQQHAQELQRQLNRILQDGQTEAMKIINQGAQQQEAVQTRMFQNISRVMNSSLQGYLQGTQTITQAVSKLWQSMGLSIVENLVKVGEQQLAAHLLHKTIAKDDVLVDAKKAAADAYQAVAGIPVVGPILAPAAAAAAFAGTMAFASFEEGTNYVPRTGFALLHQGEAVLTNPNADMMRQFLQGNGGGSNQPNFNVTMQISAIDSKSFQDTFLDNMTSTFVRKVQTKMKGYPVG